MKTFEVKDPIDLMYYYFKNNTYFTFADGTTKTRDARRAAALKLKNTKRHDDVVHDLQEQLIYYYNCSLVDTEALKSNLAIFIAEVLIEYGDGSCKYIDSIDPTKFKTGNLTLK